MLIVKRCRSFFITLLFVVLSAALCEIALPAHAYAASLPLVGPKQNYLALGDSLAFGYQPDLNYADGYSTDFFDNLKMYGEKKYANLACPGETSTTMINGACPYAFLRKYPYIEPQLDASVEYITQHSGQVSPVTLTIGANDMLAAINKKTCAIDTVLFNANLATLDNNLAQIILPRLHAALVVNGSLTGDLVMMNYYDPYQNSCPATVPYIQIVNQHLANDVSQYGRIVDVFSAFGGATVPNTNVCSYTWMCSLFHDIHPKSRGYSVIANVFENATGY